MKIYDVVIEEVTERYACYEGDQEWSTIVDCLYSNIEAAKSKVAYLHEKIKMSGVFYDHDGVVATDIETDVNTGATRFSWECMNDKTFGSVSIVITEILDNFTDDES